MLLVDSRPTKQHAMKKGALFGLLSTDILNDVDIWLFILEHSVKLKSIAMRINSPSNPFLFMRAYKN